MKKILLLGDSIRLSYRNRVQKLLADRAEIYGPDDNCRFAAYTLFNLKMWLEKSHYDIIQWNNGQWDTCYMPDDSIHTPLDLYVDLEVRIARILKPCCDRLIFATTTPVKGDMFALGDRLPRKVEDIQLYNRTVVSALETEGVETYDLFQTVVDDLDASICDDLVHLTEHGIERCAQKAAAVLNP